MHFCVHRRGQSDSWKLCELALLLLKKMNRTSHSLSNYKLLLHSPSTLKQGKQCMLREILNGQLKVSLEELTGSTTTSSVESLVTGQVMGRVI